MCVQADPGTMAVAYRETGMREEPDRKPWKELTTYRSPKGRSLEWFLVLPQCMCLPTKLGEMC